MNTYTLKIEKLGTQPNVSDLTNIVKYVAWRCFATDGINITSIYRETSLDEPSSDAFTAFEDLSEEMVVSWIENKENMEEVHHALDDILLQMATPEIVEHAAPWQSSIVKALHTHAPHEDTAQ